MTRWPHIIWPFTTMKICQISTIFKEDSIFCQSGEISPNLVTLTERSWAYLGTAKEKSKIKVKKRMGRLQTKNTPKIGIKS